MTCRIVGEAPGVADTVAWPEIGMALGIDLNPVSVREEDQARWLLSLVPWAMAERLRTLCEFVRAARLSPPVVLRGDAVQVIERLVDSVPEWLRVCVVNEHVLYQFERSERDEFEAACARASQARDVVRVGVEPAFVREGSTLRAEDEVSWHVYSGGKKVEERRMGACDRYGRWFRPDWT